MFGSNNDMEAHNGCDINIKSLIAHPTRDAALFLDLAMNLVIVETKLDSNDKEPEIFTN